MRLDEFIAQLEAAGWRSQLDAQHQRITELWRAEYPGAASYLDALETTRAELAALRAERDALKAASMLAYGYLWSVQIEPGTPGLAPHKAVPAARIVLRDVLDNDKRKAGIEQVRAALGER